MAVALCCDAVCSLIAYPITAIPWYEMAAHSFYKLCNIASFEVPQVRHLDRSWQTMGHDHHTAVLRGRSVSNCHKYDEN